MSGPTIWTDRRSGPAGAIAGNIVLRELARRFGERIRHDRGVLFYTQKHLLLARFARFGQGTRAHWANLTAKQYDRAVKEARKRKLDLLFIFITASEIEIDYWCIPSPIVGDAIAQIPAKQSDNSHMLEIFREGDRFRLHNKDVTRYHHRLAPRGRDQKQLSDALAEKKRKPTTKRKDRPLAAKSDRPGATIVPSDASSLQLQRVFVHDNQLALVLPRELVEKVNITEGSFVSARETEEGILLQSVDVVPSLTAQDEKFVEKLFKRRRHVFEALAE